MKKNIAIFVLVCLCVAESFFLGVKKNPDQMIVPTAAVVGATKEIKALRAQNVSLRQEIQHNRDLVRSAKKFMVDYVRFQAEHERENNGTFIHTETVVEKKDGLVKTSYVKTCSGYYCP